MGSTLTILQRICFLRASPSDLPYSKTLLGFFIFISALLNYQILDKALSPYNPDHLSLRIVLSYAVVVILLAAMLAAKKISNRLHKVLLAFFGTDVIFSFLRIILLTLMGLPGANGLLFFIYFWELLVRAAILRAAIGATLLWCGLLAFSIQLCEELPIISGLNIPMP